MFPALTGGNNNAKASSGTWSNSSGLGSDNKMVGPIATQNLGGNSLTQMMRSLQNYQTTQGASTFGQGTGITDAALPGFNVAGDTTGTALGSTGTAMGTTEKALDTLSPAESYWTKLLSGDQATMNQAIAPYATQAATNYGNAVTQVAQNTPRGGYSAALQSQMPFAQARDVNNMLYQLQPAAAQQLNTIAGTKGQIGGVQNAIAGTQGNVAAIQGQLANYLASLGIDVSKLGLVLTGQGSDSLMTGRGQDVGEHGQAMNLAGTALNDLTSGINTGMNDATMKKIYGG